MPHRFITCDADLADLGKLFHAMEYPFTVQWRKGRDRSLSQNSLQWKWAGEFAAQLGDRTADEVQRDWKLRHGVPILRANNEIFRQVYDELIKPLPTYGAKLEAMRIIDVTSIMTVPQMREYLDTVQREAAEQGVRLTNPESA